MALTELRNKSRSRSRILWAFFGCLVALLAVIFIAIIVCKRESIDENLNDFYTTLSATFGNAVVVTNAKPCASIGKGVLKKGGNAVDAMIASMLCDGVAMPQSMGIGGGFFMLIYNRTLNNFTAIDARETAPAAATVDMYQGRANASQHGSLAVAVPGEMKGLWTAYQMFGGGVPWRELVMPTIELCEHGIPLSGPLAMNLVKKRNLIEDKSEFRELFTDPKTGRWLQLGDKYRNPKLANTLRTIAEYGGDAMYTGGIATALVQDIQEAGGIITAEDLSNYRVRIEEPLVVPLAKGKFTLYSMKPPASGMVLAYILRILSEMLPAPNEVLTTQRMTEAFKYAYATRGELGDHHFVNTTRILDNILSDEFISKVRRQISDIRTWNDTAHYGMQAIGKEDHGTANLVIRSENGDAVVSSSTINLIFGSKVISKSTGILLNDEMDDFSTPNRENYFGLKPSEANFIKPGKRMMSSMCPTMITDHRGNLKLLIGGSGGTQITTGVAITAARNLFLDENVRVAVDHVLFHHQLVPMAWIFFPNTPPEIIEGMRKIGHNLKLTEPTSFSAVSAIEISEGNNDTSDSFKTGSTNNTVLHGICDRKRPGHIEGY